MIQFYSASVRIANSERAQEECFDIAFADNIPEDLGVVIFNATLGHKLDRLAGAVKKKYPNVTVFGSSCCGVTGREGVGESMHNIAMMAMSGAKSEYATATVNEIYGENSYEKGLELAQSLKAGAQGITAIYLLCPGIDIANDLVLNAFTETFGEDITIFGGTSADNMRGLVSYQYNGSAQTQHDAWAIGFADPTLKAVTRATHGFTAYGNAMVVTKAQGHKIIELNNRPAWMEYTARLSLSQESELNCGDTIPIGALAEKLLPKIAEEYGNPHILRVVTKFDADGTMYYPTTCAEGLELWLTVRDEELIFSEQQRSLDYLCNEMQCGKPVAVFQTDCLARGRFLFNKVMKDEIIAMMHTALSVEHEVPAWLGMYGFGEYAKLGGKNEYHNYSTALLVLYR